MQDHAPAHQYDLIWLQWVIGHLTDADFVAFLGRCASEAGLRRPGGLICIKDNVLAGKEYKDKAFIVDKQDSSLTRSDVYLKALFKAAGLRIVAEATQKMFPKELFPVKMYALEPVPAAAAGGDGAAAGGGGAAEAAAGGSGSSTLDAAATGV